MVGSLQLLNWFIFCAILRVSQGQIKRNRESVAALKAMERQKRQGMTNMSHPAIPAAWILCPQKKAFDLFALPLSWLR
ncbi:hypothetical protein [Celeribacter ethanolicus]|uniref:hypothetical protein n=1 Tax=Celeribacter ethanolicus TaxID=1758178 RepID=UPI0012DEC32A|nr:hypothetical protein [Celeribacter ethanolicus]